MTKNKRSIKSDHTVIRSRRRSIAIVVKDDGAVEIRCPSYVSNIQIEDILHSRADWIEKQQKKIANKIDLPDIEKMSDDEREYYRQSLQSKIEAFMSSYDGPRPSGFTIRKQKTRWGSCSNRGNINLNIKAVFLPDDLFEYLIEHELAHLVEMNHGYQFWAYLESRLPDARARQKRLKSYRLNSRLVR